MYTKCNMEYANVMCNHTWCGVEVNNITMEIDTLLTTAKDYEDLRDEVEKLPELKKRATSLAGGVQAKKGELAKFITTITHYEQFEEGMYNKYNPDEERVSLDELMAEVVRIADEFNAGCMDKVGNDFEKSLEAAQETIDAKIKEWTTASEKQAEQYIEDMKKKVEEQKVQIAEKLPVLYNQKNDAFAVLEAQFKQMGPQAEETYKKRKALIEDQCDAFETFYLHQQEYNDHMLDYQIYEFTSYLEFQAVALKVQLHSAMRKLVEISKGKEAHFQQGLKTFPNSAGDTGKKAAKAAAPKKRSVADSKKEIEKVRKAPAPEGLCGGCAVQ
jgi:hypothetical protein